MLLHTKYCEPPDTETRKWLLEIGVVYLRKKKHIVIKTGHLWFSSFKVKECGIAVTKSNMAIPYIALPVSNESLWRTLLSF